MHIRPVRRILRRLSPSRRMNVAMSLRPSTFELPADSSAPGLARACLDVAARPDPEVAADVALVTSEVVANAVKHAGMRPTDDILLRVDPGDRIHVEVLDTGPGFDPGRPRPGSGWGLRFLTRLAQDWGVEREANRTKVWFEVQRSGVR